MMIAVTYNKGQVAYAESGWVHLILWTEQL